MKALSLTRPWPELILRCGKRIENRTWRIEYRGPILLHAARSWEPEAFDLARRIQVESGEDIGALAIPRRREDHSTGIVGTAHLVEVCSPRSGAPCSCGPWAIAGQYHWRLSRVRPLREPVPCAGRLGLWEAPADVYAACLARLAPARTPR